MDSLMSLQVPPSHRLYLRIWAPTLLWVGVIMAAGSSLGSSEHTGHFIRWLLSAFFAHIPATGVTFANQLVRKCGHLVGYGLLSLLFLRSWWVTLCLKRQPQRTVQSGAAALAFASTAVIAFLDEWQQMFNVSRTGTWRDVLLDLMAAIFVQAIVLLFSDLCVRVLPSANHSTRRVVDGSCR